MRVEIVEYNSEWMKMFEIEKDILIGLLGSDVKVVEHVGSTSLSNQSAKPIIDIFVGVLPLYELKFYKTKLNKEEYIYINTGMNGRYLFEKHENGVWTNNIHILTFDKEFSIRNEILFRDYLRKHLDYIKEYSELKKNIISENVTDSEYTKRKTEFIQKIVDAARSEKGLPLKSVWEEDIN